MKGSLSPVYTCPPSVVNRITLLTCGVVLLAAGARVAVPRVPVPLAAPPAARLPAPALPHHVQSQGAPQADTGKYTNTPTLFNAKYSIKANCRCELMISKVRRKLLI